MPFAVRRLALLAALAATLAACGSSTPATPSGPPSPGTVAAPREVNLITKDDVFLPDALVLFPGETVLLHVINGGLEVHEAVIGGPGVQAAWEVAEAAVADAPPGPTPVVSVPPDVSGIRIVVRSGQLVDLVWTVPAEAAAGQPWIVGCHIPGHFAKGMQIPVQWAAS